MQLLGLIDTLEAIILKSKKIPMTDKVILEEKKLLSLIDKIRLVIKQGEGVIRKSIEKEIEEKKKKQMTMEMEPENEAQNIINDAYSKARQIRDGADEYADQILGNLQIIITKMQRNALKLDQVLENGRNRLKKAKELDDKSSKITSSKDMRAS